MRDTPDVSPVVETLVTMTINGRTVQGRTGQTVLEAATEAGISIPTLCHHPVLTPFGGCRLCVVQIDKQRALQPACTFPVSEGLVIQTESERVVAARRFALEMLFSERSHYCMFCPSSGGEHTSDCELQRLAYRYGMTCWPHAPNTAKPWPVDATRAHLVVDHSRCILCRRCIRACNEIVANHTLAAHHRGARTMIGADDAVPLAESSCVSCGTCLQVCPTGAIMDRHSAFLGHETDVQRTRTVCMACGLGCPIDSVTRNNRLLRVEGVWDAPNRGVLCDAGRFGVLDGQRTRVRHPMIRQGSELRECDWDTALNVVAAGLKSAASVAGLISARSTNESLIAFSRLFQDVFNSDAVSLISGCAPAQPLGVPATLDQVRDADCIAIVECDPARTHKVLAYLVRGAIDRGARLLLASTQPTEMDWLADVLIRLESDSRTTHPHEALRYTTHLKPDRLAELRKELESARHPVVIAGAAMDESTVKMLRTFPAHTRFVPLVDGPNSTGAARLNISARPVQGQALYIIATDEPVDDLPLPQAQFQVVHSSFRTPWTEQADVVLPSKIWYEKQGHITGYDGQRLILTRPVDAPADILSDWATIFLLSVKLGHPLACINVPDTIAHGAGAWR